MLMIRLQRTGRENLPTYRLVVAEKRRPVKGKFLEILGHYLPTRDPAVFEHKDERIQHWVSLGAIPSNTVARLLRRAGLKDMDKYIQTYAKQRPKKEPAPAPVVAEAAAPANVEPEAAPEVAAPVVEAAPTEQAPAAESGDSAEKAA